MKKAFALGMVLAAVAAGCSSSKKPMASSLTEPLSPAPVAYQPAPQPYTPSPVAAQPVTYDTAPAPMVASSGNSNAGASSASSGSYTVKKGDTLFSIAKSRYGNGNQYTKIISANPGLSPQSLKAGQTISVP